MAIFIALFVRVCVYVYMCVCSFACSFVWDCVCLFMAWFVVDCAYGLKFVVHGLCLSFGLDVYAL